MTDKRDLSFRQTTSSDDGGNETEAISPVSDGERADQSVFRRPSENLRLRTESVRRQLMDMLYYRDEAMAGFMLSITNATDPDEVSVTWEGPSTDPTASNPGRLSIDSNARIRIEPLLTPAAPGAYATGTIDGIDVTALEYSWRGGNNIKIQYVDSVDQPYSISMTEGPYYLVTISFDFDESDYSRPLLSTIVNDLNNLSDTSNNPFYHPDDGAAGTPNLTVMSATLTVSDTQATASALEVELQGGAEPISYYVTSSFIEDFFDVFDSPNYTNLLREGDTLAIYFDGLVDPNLATSLVGRRQRLKGSSDNVGAQLFNTSVEPEKIPGSIPICRVDSDGNLIFLDGSRLAAGQTARLSSAYFSATGTWAGGTPSALTSGDMGAAINQIVEHLAAITDVDDSGTARIGGGLSPHPSPPSNWPSLNLAQGTLQSQLWQLLLGTVAEGTALYNPALSLPWHSSSGESFAATDLQIAIEEIVNSLAQETTISGSALIGSEGFTAGGRSVGANSVLNQLKALLDELLDHEDTDVDPHGPDLSLSGLFEAADMAYNPPTAVRKFFPVTGLSPSVIGASGTAPNPFQFQFPGGPAAGFWYAELEITPDDTLITVGLPVPEGVTITDILAIVKRGPVGDSVIWNITPIVFNYVNSITNSLKLVASPSALGNAAGTNDFAVEIAQPLDSPYTVVPGQQLYVNMSATLSGAGSPSASDSLLVSIGYAGTCAKPFAS